MSVHGPGCGMCQEAYAPWHQCAVDCTQRCRRKKIVSRIAGSIYVTCLHQGSALSTSHGVRRGTAECGAPPPPPRNSQADPPCQAAPVGHCLTVALRRPADLPRNERRGAEGGHTEARVRRHAARADGAPGVHEAGADRGPGGIVVHLRPREAGVPRRLELERDGGRRDRAPVAVPARHGEHPDGLHHRRGGLQRGADRALGLGRVRGHEHHALDAGPGVVDPEGRVAPRDLRERPVVGVHEANRDAVVGERGGGVEGGVLGGLAERHPEAREQVVEGLWGGRLHHALGAGPAAVDPGLVAVPLGVRAGRALVA